MPPELNINYQGEPIGPTPATLCAWEARAYMLEHANSEADSEQARVAEERAHEKFNEMVVLTWDYVASSAHSRTQAHPGEVQEILQITYTRAFKGLPKFRGDANIETWLDSIMYRQLSTFYAKKSRESEHVEHIDNYTDEERGKVYGRFMLGGTLDPEIEFELAAERDRVMAMLDELKPGERQLLLWLDYHGISREAVAIKLGISTDALKVRVHRARKSFREKHPLEDPKLKKLS